MAAGVAVVIAGVHAALSAAGVGSVYSGAPLPAPRPPFVLIGECQEVPNLRMGRRGSDVIVPVHVFRADGSAVKVGETIAAIVAALEGAATITVTGRTVADVGLEGIEMVGAEFTDGKPVYHGLVTFRVWLP